MIKDCYNILLIDDDRGIRDLLEEFLEERGYEVEAIGDGRDVIGIIKAKVFDVVIVDLKMPGMDGIEVLKRIKQLDPDTVVIIMTGYASLETAIQAIREGAYDYITKPFQLEEMYIAIKNACEKVSLKRQYGMLLSELRQFHKDKREGIQKVETSDTREDDKELAVVLERLAYLVGRGMITSEEFDLLRKRCLQDG